MEKSKKVIIQVNQRWFDGWFEPKRKQYETKLGIRLSQNKFTEILAKQNRLRMPRQDMRLLGNLRRRNRGL